LPKPKEEIFMTVTTAQSDIVTTRNQWQTAMMEHKQNEIEIEQIRVIKCQHPLTISWCKACGAQTNMVRVLEAATLIDSTPYEIYRRVEASELHFGVSTNGELFICLNSLLDEQPLQPQPLKTNFSC
jgi:hypothetical protein